jgi:hypothetical protein
VKQGSRQMQSDWRGALLHRPAHNCPARTARLIRKCPGRFCSRPAAAPIPLRPIPLRPDPAPPRSRLPGPGCLGPDRRGWWGAAARAGRARLLASAAAAASRVPWPVSRVAFPAPFLGIGMCISHLRVNHNLPRISDSCALADRAGRGQRKLANDCRFCVTGRRIHAMTGEPTNPGQWTSYSPCTGTL